MVSDYANYFCTMWNWIDIIIIGGSSVYVADTFAHFMSEYLWNVIGSIVVLMFVFKLIYYLRAFEDYAIFIRMVLDMIGAPELVQFWLMLFVCIAGFACIIMVLNFNRNDDDAPIYEDVIGNPALDTLIHSWLTGLGEYGKDDYAEKNATSMWIYFVLATVMIQLVFMNLLIAIMSEQYTRLNEAKEQNKLKETCKMMSEHTWLLKPNLIYQSDRYIIFIGPNRGQTTVSATEKKIFDL